MLGDNIRKIRKEKKISINNLSKMTGISLGYLSDLENNNAKNPTMEKLETIANALGVSVKSFLNDEEKLSIASDSISKIMNLAKEGLQYNSYESNIDNLYPHESPVVYNTSANKNDIYSIAMNFENEKFSENELKEIVNFIEYIISKR